MVEQHAHGFGEAIGALRTNMVHDLIEQAMVVLVGVGHFGFVLFAKTSKPIWPAPATPDPISQPFYATASATLRPTLRKPEKSELQKGCYTGAAETRINVAEMLVGVAEKPVNMAETLVDLVEAHINLAEMR